MCKITLFSKRHVHLAKTRRNKAAAAKEISDKKQSSSAATPAVTEISRRLSRTSDPIHDKNLCVWCMKARDEKHPTRDKWHLMQTMDAWYAFKVHTVYLKDSVMRDRILALMDANRIKTKFS